MRKPDALVGGSEDDTPDAALLVRVANGDPGAARVLTERLGPRILRHVARMLGDVSEAEDIVQETFLRLWRMAPDWRQGDAKLSTWAFRVAINLSTDRLRSRRGDLSLDVVADPIDQQTAQDQRLTADQRILALDAALSTLPERQRQAVSLRHIEELTNPEIAEIMDISVEAVESLTARGKRALAATLRERKNALGFHDDD